MTGILEARMFKAVPGGYIFQPPPPSSFHASAAYLINEAQKTKILAIMRARAGLGQRSLAYISLVLAITAGVAMDQVVESPFMVSVFIGACVALVTQIVGTALALHLTSRQLRPFLADLPQSHERLF